MSWLMGRSQRHAYEYLLLLLKYLQWQDQGGRGRPWILKSIFHLGNFDLLAETFPDATVVHTHRDPSTVLASFLRMWELLWALSSDEVDLSRLGRLMLNFWSGQTAKGIAQRDRLGSSAAFVDVSYEAVCDDPMTVIRDIYKVRGQKLSATAEREITGWAATNPQHLHGTHKYSLERYGLTRSDVDTAFAPYLERYFPG
jgi:hypothetical protein